MQEPEYHAIITFRSPIEPEDSQYRESRIDMEFLILFLVYALIFGSICAYLAGEKGRSGGSWFFLGLVFGILALLVLIALPSEQRSSNEPVQASTRSTATASTRNGRERQDPDIRLCPHCIKEVHKLATACPHCQRDLPEVERCSDAACRKIINPTDKRCKDDEGNLYCCDLHRQRQLDLARSPSYVPYKRPIEVPRERTVKCDMCSVEVLESSMTAHRKIHIP